MIKQIRLLAAVLLACGAAAAAPESVLLRAVKQGQMSAAEKPAREVARTQSEWTALWARQFRPGQDVHAGRGR